MRLVGVRSNRGDSYQTLVAFEWTLSILTDGNYQWLDVDSTSLDISRNPVSVNDEYLGLRKDAIQPRLTAFTI